MDLCQIFVLAQVRLCKNMSYDDLHYIVNSDKIVRQLMGVESKVLKMLETQKKVRSVFVYHAANKSFLF